MITEQLEKKLKISKNTGIHCPTLELAIQVLSIFHQSGLRWKSETPYTLNHNWDSFKESTVYYPFRGECSSFSFANLTGYIIIRAEEFIALHTEAKEFYLETYEPKGDLKGFPKEIIARMLECQKEQGNKIDVSVFEKRRAAGEDDKGFNWCRTKEGSAFWEDVIRYKNFASFFERYPKKEEIKVSPEKQEIKVCSMCKECRKQELKNNKNMQENNKKEDNSQKFRVGDKVIDIILDLKGIITNVKSNGSLEIQFEGKSGITEYNLKIEKRPSLLHYRDDYDYDVIDFNNLPKRQEAKRWRAEKNRIYYYVNFYTKDWFLPDETYDYYTPMDHDNYYSGNYLQTKEEAQEVADKLNKYFQELLNTIKMMKS